MSLRLAANCPYHSNVRLKLTFLWKSACLAALLFSLISPAGAQQNPQPAPPPFNPAIYRIGERLTYDVSFAHFVSAAHVELLVAGRGRYFNRDGIELRAHVETTGVINVALLALNNDYTTYIDAVSGMPYRSQQVVRQPGKASEATSSNNHPAGTDAIPSKSFGSETTGAFDLLSAVYRLRAVPMIEGTSFLISAVSESQEFPAEMRIAGRAMIKTGVGSF